MITQLKERKKHNRRLKVAVRTISKKIERDLHRTDPKRYTMSQLLDFIPGALGKFTDGEYSYIVAQVVKRLRYNFRGVVQINQSCFRLSFEQLFAFTIKEVDLVRPYVTPPYTGLIVSVAHKDGVPFVAQTLINFERQIKPRFYNSLTRIEHEQKADRLKKAVSDAVEELTPNFIKILKRGPDDGGAPPSLSA